jgi:hypothetical protein
MHSKTSEGANIGITPHGRTATKTQRQYRRCVLRSRVSQIELIETLARSGNLRGGVAAV